MAHAYVSMSGPLKGLLGASVLLPVASTMTLLLWRFEVTDCDWGCHEGASIAVVDGGQVRCAAPQLHTMRAAAPACTTH